MSEIIRLEKLDSFKFKDSKIAAVLGFFDGVHTGHFKIIDLCVKKARQMEGLSVVFTFDKPPVNILKGSLFKKLITSYADKIELIKKIGVDFIVVAKFSKEFAELEPGQFCRNILLDRLNVKEVFVGTGFKFGKNSKGDIKYLKSFFASFKPDTKINEVEICKIDNMPVSSTVIRKLYNEGDIDNIVKFLGRHPSIKGKVIRGDQRGRLLGYPTANIDVFEKYLTLKDGVYAGIVNIFGRFNKPGNSENMKKYQYFKKMPSLINIGQNPTFKGNRKWIESHILDFKKDIYGKRIEIIFLKRIRDEITFCSKEALINQIESDVASARIYFSKIKNSIV